MTHDDWPGLCYDLPMSRLASTLLFALALTPASGASAEPLCSCKANGQTYQLGEIACFSLPNGQKRARCDKVLNNTSWTFLDGDCPSASADRDTRLALLCERPGTEKTAKARHLPGLTIRTTM